jgi:serine/threonine protein kinase
MKDRSTPFPEREIKSIIY